MKIVQFDNGKYGVRKFGWPFHFCWVYKDFAVREIDFWWPMTIKYFNRGDCFTDLETAQSFILKTPPAKVVNRVKVIKILR